MHKNSALLVVDLQPDFCASGPLAVPGGDEIVPLINELAQKFETVVLTQDWHPGLAPGRPYLLRRQSPQPSAI
jgi:nicotinamidase/pyrazinamidase